MRHIPTYREVSEPTGAEVPEQVAAQRDRLARRLERIGRVVAVASGKGGVGKSAVVANLAASLARRGRRVGALDADLNGPSLARMLGVSGETLGDGEGGVEPPRGAEGVRVMSMELLQSDDDAPLEWKGPRTDGYLWRGALETGVLREFLSDVEWGTLDVLLVDVPPGTDRIRRLLELVPDLHRMLLVTTPARMSRLVVSRSVRLAREARPGRVALVSNMTHFHCPDCGSRSDLFPGGGAEELVRSSGLDLWAAVPFDPLLGSRTDRGNPVVLAEPDAPSSRALEALADRMEAELAPEPQETDDAAPDRSEGETP